MPRLGRRFAYLAGALLFVLIVHLLRDDQAHFGDRCCDTICGYLLVFWGIFRKKAQRLFTILRVSEHFHGECTENFCISIFE